MEGEDTESDNPRAFPNKNVWQRISVVFAGPFFNFILAFVCAFVVICFTGYDAPVIYQTIDGYPAAEAGLTAGDTIVSINGHHVHFASDVRAYSLFHLGEDATIVYKRDGVKYTTTVVPKYSEEDGTYLYGFQWSGVAKKDNIFANFGHAFYEVRYYIYVTLQSLRSLVTGGASMNDLSGPVGIVSTVGNDYEAAVAYGGLRSGFLMLMEWMILLSANLGVMNLLPLPALDGGRLVFLIVEAIRRKKVDPNKEGFVHMIGIVLLLLLMVIVMFNDIRKLFV